MILAGIGLLLLLIGIIAGIVVIRGKLEEKKAQEAREKKQQEEEAARLEEENNTLHMVAVGDNMIHDAIIKAGKSRDWNFDFLYESPTASPRQTKLFTTFSIKKSIHTAAPDTARTSHSPTDK